MSAEPLPGAAAPAESRAFMAALLKACRSDCDCEVCCVLRNIADRMAEEFKPGGKPRGRGTRKT